MQLPSSHFERTNEYLPCFGASVCHRSNPCELEYTYQAMEPKLRCVKPGVSSMAATMSVSSCLSAYSAVISSWKQLVATIPVTCRQYTLRQSQYTKELRCTSCILPPALGFNWRVHNAAVILNCFPLCWSFLSRCSWRIRLLAETAFLRLASSGRGADRL